MQPWHLTCGDGALFVAQDSYALSLTRDDVATALVTVGWGTTKDNGFDSFNLYNKSAWPALEALKELEGVLGL